MTLKQFIKERRAELDSCIARALGLDKNEATMKVLELIEDCFYDVDPEEFTYTYLGREDEVIEQEELE